MSYGPSRCAIEILENALERVPDGQIVRFWWRDDDASARTPALERLLKFRDEFGLPLALAVVPGRMQQSIVDTVGGQPGVDVLVHGWLHRNCAAENEPAHEFLASRDPAEMANELRAALSRSQADFPQQCLPVFVPPWNRFPSELEPLLREAGYTGISASSNRPPFSKPASNGLRRADVHLNLVRWDDGPRLADVGKIAERVAKQIRDGARGPFGICTHHGDHDEKIWAFCAGLWSLIGSHRHAEAVSAGNVFRNPESIRPSLKGWLRSLLGASVP
jgi:hypothetical protein